MPTLQKLLAEELKLPHNCFTLKRDGLHAGVELTLNKPKLGVHTVYPPHLNFGESFIGTGRGKQACLYRVVTRTGRGQVGLVRRAIVAEVTPRDEIKKPFRVLNRPGDDDKLYGLLHITSTQYPKDITLKRLGKNRAFADIVGNVHFFFKQRSDALAKFGFDGDFVHVMYDDGVVHRVERIDGKLEFTKLDDHRALEARLTFAREMFPDAPEGLRNAIILRTIHLLAFAQHSDICDKLVTFLQEHRAKYGLSSYSLKLIVKYLRKLDDNRALEFDEDSTKGISEVPFLNRSEDRKGPPPKEVARKRDRSERDRQAYLDKGGKKNGKNKKGGAKKRPPCTTVTSFGALGEHMASSSA